MNLAVVEHRRHEVAPRGVARAGPGGHEDEHIHLARLHDWAALRGVDDAKLDGVGVAERGRRDGAAKVDVEAGKVAPRVEEAEAGGVVEGRADHLAPVAHRVQPRPLGIVAARGAGRHDGQREDGKDESAAHLRAPQGRGDGVGRGAFVEGVACFAEVVADFLGVGVVPGFQGELDLYLA